MFRKKKDDDFESAYIEKSQYTARVIMCGGNEYTFKWAGPPSINLMAEQRPITAMFFRYRNKAGRSVVIPWHQIARLELEESPFNIEVKAV